MRYDLTDLRLFLCVVDAGSITHGAADMGLSLPAASERLRDMELIGQVKLLERGRRGVALTDAGMALAHHARIVLRQMSNMHEDLISHARGMRLSVRLLANTAAMSEHLPAPLARWMAQNPQIDIDLKERPSNEIARAIAGGFADIGILSDAVETDTLQLLPFTIDRLVVIAPADHTICQKKSLSLADILHEPFVGLSAGALSDHIESHATRLGAKLKMRTRLRTFEGLGAMVCAGVGLAIIPETAARRLKRTTKVVSVPLTDKWATRQLSICIRAIDSLPSAARDLAQQLSKISA